MSLVDFTEVDPPSFNGLFFIGERPGTQEFIHGRPFVGPSGNLLRALARRRTALDLDESVLGNVLCHERDSEENKKWARERLKSLIGTYKPRGIVLLGQAALSLAQGPKEKITNWRGSVFRGVPGSFLENQLCLATYNPAAVFRKPEWIPILGLDLAKTLWLEENYKPQERERLTGLSTQEMIARLDSLRNKRKPIAFDIEGGVRGVSCISIATSPTESFCVQFEHLEQAEFEKRWKAMRLLLTSRTPKILQNAMYDCFVLAHVYKCVPNNVVGDTMLATWELDAELPKSLAMQASLYTDVPYYKEGRNERGQSLYQYCCTDSLVTYDCWDQQMRLLKDGSERNYLRNVAMLRPLLYIELRGMKYATLEAAERASRKRGEKQATVLKLQLLHREVSKSEAEFNPASPQQKLQLLYTELRLPVQKKKDAYGILKPTTERLALLKLVRWAKNNPNKAHKQALKILQELLDFSVKAKELQMLSIKPDSDGRIRASYNLVGTVTGRLGCSKSPTGTGFNLQTIPKKERDLFLADPGCYIFQIDLSGADGWTVAAWSKLLGDDTLLEDLRAKLKIPQILTHLSRNPAVFDGKSREWIKSFCQQNPITEEEKAVAKAVQHGSNYGMGKLTMSMNILKKSEGKVFVTSAKCEEVKIAYFRRYPGIRRWQQYVQTQYGAGKLVSASGNVRTFLDRSGSANAINSAYSHEPQSNTSFATNSAILRLWNDPENRTEKGKLRVEPLHQVHDALVGQFRVEETQWAVGKLRSWFDNTLEIGGSEKLNLKIPYEGAYGLTWGDCEHEDRRMGVI